MGDWLAEVAGLLRDGRPLVIAGGTGLYLTALTSGLAVIPPGPPEIRAEGDAGLARGGLEGMVAARDARAGHRRRPLHLARSRHHRAG